MITKEMLARCQNPLKQAFCALDAYVQKAIKENVGYAECLQSGRGGDTWLGGYSGVNWPLNDAYTWRLSPDTPTEPEYNDVLITPNEHGYYMMPSVSMDVAAITLSVINKKFIGILYRASDGTETWRTSVDAAFGTPIKVRFTK